MNEIGETDYHCGLTFPSVEATTTDGATKLSAVFGMKGNQTCLTHVEWGLHTYLLKKNSPVCGQCGSERNLAEPPDSLKDAFKTIQKICKSCEIRGLPFPRKAPTAPPMSQAAPASQRRRLN